MQSVDDSVYYEMMNDYLWRKWRYISMLNDDLQFKYGSIHLSMRIWENGAEAAFTRFHSKCYARTP